MRIYKQDRDVREISFRNPAAGGVWWLVAPSLTIVAPQPYQRQSAPAINKLQFFTMIRIMVYRHSAFYSPLLATVAAGFLKEEGPEAEYFLKPKDRNLYEMFRQGEVD